MTPEALLDLFVLAPVGLVEVDEDGRVDVANLAARSLLGPFTRSGSLDDLWTSLGDIAARARAFEAPRGVVIERMEFLAPDDSRGVAIALVKTNPSRFILIAYNASPLATARRELTRLNDRLRALENAVHDYASFTVDATGLIDSWNASAVRMHQYSAEEAIGQPLSILVPPSAGETHAAEALERASENGWCEQEAPRRRKDATTFPANTIVTALRDYAGTPTGYTVVTRDLSDHKRLENALREDASSTVDYLTGVSSQRPFLDIAGSEVARARRYGQPLTALLIKPDNFRELAEAHGQAFSDECLRAIAWACQQESRTTDFVGRVGGEEFAILLPSTELAGGLVLAERIRERMQRHAFSGDFASVRCTLSIGVAELGEQEASVETLLAHAATAVERAEAAGRNLVVGFD